MLSGSYLICILFHVKIVRESSLKCICFTLVIFMTLHHTQNVQGLCHSSELDTTFSRFCIWRMFWMIFDGCMYWGLECVLSSHRQMQWRWFLNMRLMCLVWHAKLSMDMSSLTLIFIFHFIDAFPFSESYMYICVCVCIFFKLVY